MNRKTLLLLVVLAALATRLTFLASYHHTFYWISIWSDSSTYNQWARRIVTTHDWLGEGPFFMTPLYPYFLAIVYSIFGESLMAVRLLQVAFSTATVVCIYLIGERLFSRKAGFIAALIAAVYGPFILNSMMILVETLKVFFLTLALLLLILANGKRRWWFAAGAANGLAILCRPSDFLVAVVVLLWIAVGVQRSRREKLVSAGAFTAAIFLIVGSVTLRNYLVSGELILITSNGGLNLYLGNNAKAVGVYYNVDQLDLANDPDGRVYLETLLNKPLRASEVSAYWSSRAIEFITHQPTDFLSLLARKALLFFHYKEIAQLGYNYQFIADTSIPSLSYYPTFLIVGPLGILGIVLCARQWRGLFLLYGFFLAEFAGVVLFFVTDRFRLSAMPFLILFAGAAIARLHEQWRDRKFGTPQAAAILLVAAVLMTSLLNINIPDEYSTEYEYIGLMYFDAKQYDNALASFRQSLSYRNTYHIHNNIGNVYLAKGNPGAAMEEYNVGNILNPHQAISWFSMGTAYVNIQDWNSALAMFEKSIEINPRFAPAYLNKGLTLYYLQRFQEALEFLQKYVELEKDQSKLTTVYADIENLRRLVGERRGVGK